MDEARDLLRLNLLVENISSSPFVTFSHWLRKWQVVQKEDFVRLYQVLERNEIWEIRCLVIEKHSPIHFIWRRDIFQIG